MYTRKIEELKMKHLTLLKKTLTNTCKKSKFAYVKLVRSPKNCSKIITKHALSAPLTSLKTKQNQFIPFFCNITLIVSPTWNTNVMERKK